MRQIIQRPVIATTLLTLSLIAASATAQSDEGDNIQTALIIKDLGECGHGEYVMFTVLWKGVVGIAAEPSLFGWNKPSIGDRLSGHFLEEASTEATYINKPGVTDLDIVKTGIPIANQGALLGEFCAKSS